VALESFAVYDPVGFSQMLKKQNKDGLVPLQLAALGNYIPAQNTMIK
jgi:hypothetical protein